MYRGIGQSGKHYTAMGYGFITGDTQFSLQAMRNGLNFLHCTHTMIHPLYFRLETPVPPARRSSTRQQPPSRRPPADYSRP